MEQQLIEMMDAISRKLDELTSIVVNSPTADDLLELRAKIDAYEDIQSKKVKQPEAARYLGVSYNTISRMREKGMLKATLFGKSWYYRISDLDKFIKKNTI